MLHYEQVFVNVFKRRESKCCGVLMKNRRKVKVKQVITLQKAQQLKAKILMLYQGNYFVASVRLNFSWRQTHYIDEQNKVQSVTDTDNEFTGCQTPRKKLQSIGILLVSLHSFTKTLKSDISERSIQSAS